MISQTLPPDAVAKLLVAGQTSNDKDPLAKQKAIEKATAEIKQKYPKFFKQEEIENEVD